MGAVPKISRPSKIIERRKLCLTSRGYRAGLHFPIGAIHHDIQRRTKKGSLVTNDAAAFTGGVIEYLLAEIIEQAGSLNGAQDGSPLSGSESSVIQPAHLRLVFWQDPELRQMLRNILSTTASSGRKKQCDREEPEIDLCHIFQSLSVER